MKNLDVIWQSLVEDLSQFCKWTKEQKAKLEKSKIGKLIGLLPYVAGCINPDRLAMSHLLMYAFCLQNPKYSDYRKVDNQSLLKRIFTIINYDGGNVNIIEKGKLILSLNMLADYNRDVKEDKEKNKYNPITNNIYDYETTKSYLLNEIEVINELLASNEITAEASTMIDSIIPPEEIVRTWWN